MKRCPTCQRTYPDDAPNFCTNDGTRLVAEESEPEFDPQKTVLATAPPPRKEVNQASQPQNNPSTPVPPQLQAPPQQAWQPQPPQQQQGQNWGGGFYQQPQQYAAQWPPQYAQQTAGSKSLTLATLIIGIISALGLALIFGMVKEIIPRDRDVAQIAYYASAALGVIALLLGLLALISKRQRSKWMAIVGLVLGIPAILFFIYIQFFR
ncbi:MAG: hypothetical protein M3362_09325 [Acidobacteriota bacterium]|nr:hypothetical protein [Acidobacteriota bacterium]